MKWTPGDIVLFQSYGDSWVDQQKTKIVQGLTHGPYVHAAILLAASGTTIQANTNGIGYGSITKDTKCTVVDIRAFAKDPPLYEARIHQALAALVKLQEAGTPYGILDILDQGIRLLPRSIPWWYVHQAHRFDCSNLAMYFLDKAGVLIPDVFTQAYDASPNDVAEFLGLLPDRHQVWK